MVQQKQLSWQTIRRLKIVQGVLIFGTIALPWYLAVGFATDGVWLKGFFIEHNFDRYTSTMEGHRGFPLAPFAILLASLLPFSVFIVQAVRLVLKHKNPFLFYCLLICVTFAVFFSLSKTILPSYPAPAIPFLAIVLAHYLDHYARNFKLVSACGLRTGGMVNIVIGLAICVGVYVAMTQESQLESMKYLSLGFLVIPVGSAIGFYFGAKGRPERLIYVWSASWMLASVFFFCFAFPPVDSKNPINESLPIITASTHSGYRVVGYKLFNPSLVFQIKKPIEVVHTPEEAKALLRREKVILVTRQKYLDDLPKDSSLHVVYRGKDLFEKNETVVLAN
jgi:4-amino-4-deoxy-L-arabinose transferase-like glycosyltransferase